MKTSHRDLTWLFISMISLFRSARLLNLLYGRSASLLGRIPWMIMVFPIVVMTRAISDIVSTMSDGVLWSRLFVPTDNMTYLALGGTSSWRTRQSTCSARSPPMPMLSASPLNLFHTSPNRDRPETIELPNKATVDEEHFATFLNLLCVACHPSLFVLRGLSARGVGLIMTIRKQDGSRIV